MPAIGDHNDTVRFELVNNEVGRIPRSMLSDQRREIIASFGLRGSVSSQKNAYYDGGMYEVWKRYCGSMNQHVQTPSFPFFGQ
jgi:hypothetical protein